MKNKILIVDDDLAIQTAIRLALKTEAYELDFALSPDQAIKKIEEAQPPDLIFLDLHFPHGSGLNVLRHLCQTQQRIPTLLISGAATAKEAVEGIKLGAFDYLEKPLSSERLRISIQRTLNHHQEWLILNSLTHRNLGPHPLIGESESMHKVRQSIARYAASDLRVLITGETGCGKEVVAQNIVDHSPRADKPYLIINSAAIPEALMESELFGHRRGSFTGATTDRIGKIEMAHRGTLFLDEIGDLSLGAQAKLLRFLETGEIQRVGDNNIRKVDVRVLAATSKNLEKLMTVGQFREDLYYRLNVARIHLAPLRTRPEDILPLLEYFTKTFSSRFQSEQNSPLRFTKEALAILKSYTWPGNIRELRSFAERCFYENIVDIEGSDLSLLLTPTQHDQLLYEKDSAKVGSNNPPKIKTADRPIDSSAVTSETILPLRLFKQTMEREYIEGVIRFCEGNISRAAAKLEIDRSYLHQKMSTWKKD